MENVSENFRELYKRGEIKMKILSRLFVSWLWINMTIGILGFLVISSIVIHDSYVAYTSFRNYNNMSLSKIDPNGITFTQLSLIGSRICRLSESEELELLELEEAEYQASKSIIKKSWKDSAKVVVSDEKCKTEIKLIEEQGFDVNKFGESYHVYVSSLWGDIGMSNIGNLLGAVYWILVAIFIIVISILFKKWIKYIFDI